MQLSKPWMLALLWWLLWCGFHGWIVLHYHFSSTIALTDSLLSNAILVVLCTGAGYSVRYQKPKGINLLYMLSVVLICAGIYTWLSVMLLENIFDDTMYSGFLTDSTMIRFATGTLMLVLFVLAGWLTYYLSESLAEENRRMEMNRIAKETELANLREQLQPHFLFNTLNSVSALVGKQPDKARQMIQQLSGFLRGTLTNEKKTHLTLSEELNHLELYLSIEKVRFGDRLQTSVTASDEALQLKIPALVLQPLLENAIKFGLYDTVGNVMISINAAKRNTNLEITITNPYEKNAVSAEGTGFGLQSIKRKLFLLYGRNDLLNTLSGDDKFVAMLTIPQP